MARMVRNQRLESRTSRASLAPRNAPYWCTIAKGRAIGYRKGTKGGSWLARYRSQNGGRCQRQLGPADDALDAQDSAVLSFDSAQGAARAWFSELDQNNGRRPARYTVGNALDDYLEAFTGKAKEQIRWTVERYVREPLGQLQVNELTPEQLRNFLRGLAEQPAGYRPNKKGVRKLRPTTDDSARARRATANRIFASLKAALNLAYRNGKVGGDDAWRRVTPFPKVDAPRTQYLSPSEALRLVNASEAHFRPLVQAALLTGARWSELCRMRGRHVDLTAGVILIPESKSGSPRYVHLTDEGIALFRSLASSLQRDDLVFKTQHGRPFGASHQVRPMREACKNANISHVGFHILRHTYGSRLAMAGVPMAVIAEALGHADERITRKHYAHLSPSYVRDAIRAGLGSMGVFVSPNVTPLKLAIS